MVATGLGLLDVKDFHPANYLPAIFIALFGHLLWS